MKKEDILCEILETSSESFITSSVSILQVEFDGLTDVWLAVMHIT